MKKLNVILHETTIIDFPFFWKLVHRYKVLSLVIPVIVLAFSFFYYQGQINIYQSRKYFKNLTADMNSTTQSIASVLGEKTSTLTESEIVGLIRSLDFQQNFTKYVLSHPDLRKLNFGSLNDKKDFSMDSYLEKCAGKEDCLLYQLRGRIFGLVGILPDAIETNKYYIQASSRDPFTTKFLLNEISKMIVESRVDTIKHKIDEQIKLSKELATTKRNKIDSVNLGELRDKKGRFEAKVQEISIKISDYNRQYQKLKLDLALVETQVNETKKASKGQVSSDVVVEAQKRRSLEKQARKYEQDILAIQSLSSKLSDEDALIVNQLQQKLNDTKEKLKKIVKINRGISSNTKFILKKEGESKFTEFNYRVLKQQVVKAKDDIEKLTKEREELSNEISLVDAKIEEVKPAFEYLKLLDQKIVQLDFFNSTVVSDLKFEQELSPVVTFKKTGKTKVILFSIVSSFSFLCFVIFTFYLFDDRIFDQTELQKSFEDLTIIGNTPDFD